MMGFESTAAPVGTAVEAHLCWLPRHRKSAGAARELLRSFLADRPGGELVVDAAELVVSELVANAVMHAGSPRGRLIAVQFEMVSGHLRIEVQDACNERPVLRPAVDEGDESGRGLRLVSGLASSWGCDPRASGVGKVVWALLGPVGSEL